MPTLEELKQQEAELEAQMLGNQETEVTSATEEGVQQSEDEQQAAEWMEEHIVPDPPAPPEEIEDIELRPQPEKKPRNDWKKRFVGLQRSHEASIRAHENEVLALKQTIADLQKAMFDLQNEQREVQGDIFDGAFSQEDVDTFGEDGMAVVKKATQTAIEKQIAPLKEQLARSERERLAAEAARAKDAQAGEYQQFLSRLGELAPDYAELNADSEFLTWLGQPDDFSGLPRKTLLRQAEKARDVMRVADFFNSFKATQVPLQRQPSPEARKHITPTGTGGAAPSSSGQQQEQYLRKSDIDKFFADVSKGRYRGQDDVVKATEAQIEEAYANNRILYGQ